MFFHDFALSRSLIIDTAQVQHAMDDDAHEFGLIRRTQHLGIAGNRVKRDDHVAGNVARIGVVKRDNVRVIIMPEELAVGGQDILVVTEDVGQAPYPLSVALSHLDNPLLHRLGVEAWHLHVALGHVIDFGHNGSVLKNGTQR